MLKTITMTVTMILRYHFVVLSLIKHVPPFLIITCFKHNIMSNVQPIKKKKKIKFTNSS